MLRITEAQTYGDIAVTSHDLSTQAAAEVFALGGNAVDAAIAANAVLGVCEPQTCGVGGDLFALIYVPGEVAPRALNASGRAGAGALADELFDGLSSIPWDHPVTATVPGCVDGWVALADELGSMPLSEVLAPAMRIAANGFPMSTELAESLGRRPAAFRDQASAHPFYASGEPQRGTRVARHDLQETLRAIGNGGRAAFYEGTPGRAISRSTGGIITAEDLRRNQADWIDPIALNVFGRTAWTIPPNSQGYLTLAASWIFQQLEPPQDPEDPLYFHYLIEAYRSVAHERDHLLADPDHAEVPVSELLAPRRLDSHRASITGQAGRWPAPGDAPGGTTYLCALDGNGLGISLIQSNFMGIGNGIAAEDQGFFLHNRGAGFVLQPDHPNRLEPGKRPLHTLSPSMWTDGSRLDLILGTRGGHQQPQIMAQVAAHLYWANRRPGRAQALPRWSTERLAGTSQVEVEATLPTATIGDLERRGHEVVVKSPLEGGWGPVSIITVDEDGLRTGAPDPRVDTTSVAAR